MCGVNPKLPINLSLFVGELGEIKNSHKHRIKRISPRCRKNRKNNFGCSEQEEKTYEYLFHGDATMPNI